MTLGIAASSSVAKEMGLRSGLGHISVTNTATATASGTAISRANMEETMVPKINGRAPNSPATGSQALVAKKWNPNFCQASAERCKSSDRVRPTTASTASAATSIRPLKIESGLNSDRPHPGVFCALVTRDILGDSGDPMGFDESGPKACPDFSRSGTETCLSGAAPMSSVLHFSRPISSGGSPNHFIFNVTARLLNHDE